MRDDIFTWHFCNASTFDSLPVSTRFGTCCERRDTCDCRLWVSSVSMKDAATAFEVTCQRCTAYRRLCHVLIKLQLHSHSVTPSRRPQSQRWVTVILPKSTALTILLNYMPWHWWSRCLASSQSSVEEITRDLLALHCI